MQTATLTGVWFGLGAAFCQSLSYVFSRRFVGRTGASPLLLLVVSHVLMGLASLVLLVILRPKNMPPVTGYLWPLIGASFFYLMAQWGLFSILRRVESSRVAPLLGGKVLVLALITVLFARQPLHVAQWAGVALSATGAWLLNEAGGRIPASCLVTLGFTIIGYCLSDMNIASLMKRLAGATPHPAVIGTSLAYVLCGVAIIPVSFRRDLLRREVWTTAAPYAGAWLASMCFLYACFGTIGVVFGNVVQSTRGVMAVALGWAIAHAGHAHIESKAPPTVLWRRLAGAVLMLAAVVSYMLG